MNDLLRYNRHGLAGAYRRLADECLRAAAVLVDDETLPGQEAAAHDAVLGRVESVRHARTLLAATRTGLRAADTKRRAS